MKKIFKLLGLLKREDIDLSQPVKLRLIKNELFDYLLQWYNPYYSQWWYFPSGSAGIHEPWSLYQKGSYGEYNIHRISCTEDQFSYYKNRFKTFLDVDDYLKKMNDDYIRFQNKKIQDSKKPNIIY